MPDDVSFVDVRDRGREIPIKVLPVVQLPRVRRELHIARAHAASEEGQLLRAEAREYPEGQNHQ
jgi:hypothetical protein